jgi:hypothetical protein
MTNKSRLCATGCFAWRRSFRHRRIVLPTNEIELVESLQFVSINSAEHSPLGLTADRAKQTQSYQRWRAASIGIFLDNSTWSHGLSPKKEGRPLSRDRKSLASIY